MFGKSLKNVKKILKVFLLDKNAKMGYNNLRPIRKFGKERAMNEYMTRQRRLLYDFLAQRADRRFTAREAADALSDEISRSAVYRNLAALEREGLITRSVPDGSREIYYQYLRCGDCRERIHLTCTSCGGSFHMEEAHAERLLKTLSEEMGFRLNKTKTVLYGVCEECAETETGEKE